tara:strand:+ start:117 stop:860 length:744 start_codon:yes stop_codon:yes gene_type:complete
MRAQEKNIKGFNLLEVLIVIVIIGFVSAVAYPNLNNWSKERKGRGAAIKIKSLMEKINAQVQRGNYAFVQVYFNAATDDATGKWSVFVKSRGMKVSTLNSKINDGDNDWNKTASSRCNIASDTYWDDDPQGKSKGGTGTDILEVQKISLEDVMLSFEGEAAICFSKNAKWFSGSEAFTSGDDDDPVYDERMFLCLKSGLFKTCQVNETSGTPADTKQKDLYSIDWTRFGDITIDRWSVANQDWALLQ